MKETLLSICEKNFILEAASEFKRLDGRKLDGFRELKVFFGTDWGLCYASLGETRAITQVTCEVQQPNITRPNEGLLYINVDLSSMAAPHVEPGRGSDLSNHLNVLLEKCIKDSMAVDLESLCLVAEEKVWALRVDVNILNHDGNLVECASVATLAALAHFKRPDVTTDGQEIVIHSITDRDPIPITLHHFPVCITYALLNNGENVLADPTALEERISDASLIFGINAYGEICALHLGGNALVQPDLILRYSKKAATKAKELVGNIKQSLTKDAEARKLKESFGLVECIHWDQIKSMSDSRLKIQLNKFAISDRTKKENDQNALLLERNGPRAEVIDLGDNCAELVPVQRNKLDRIVKTVKNVEKALDSTTEQILLKKVDVVQSMEEDAMGFENFGEGGPSKWEMDVNVKEQDMEDFDSSKSDDEIHELEITPKEIESIELSGDSEEDVIVLQSEDIENPGLASKPGKLKAKSASVPPGKPKESIQDSKSGEFRKNKKKRRKLPKRN